MSVLAYIYVCVNCQELHNYTELLIYIYIHKQNETRLRSSLFLKELSLARWQHLFVSRVQ